LALAGGLPGLRLGGTGFGLVRAAVFSAMESP
jgi:hypothetical protein